MGTWDKFDGESVGEMQWMSGTGITMEITYEEAQVVCFASTAE